MTGGCSSMASDFETVFAALRKILQREANLFSVTEDTPKRYCLAGPVGPATLQAWRGKMKSPTIPVAWVQIGKSYVSFHHMALYVNEELRGTLSTRLRAHMQGKSCFNFKTVDEPLFEELETVTAKGCRGMKRAGFIQ